MTPSEYQKLCERTESEVAGEAWAFRTAPLIRKLMHGSIGVATESGELLDVIKKHVWYGKPIDLANIEEEIGDMLWYAALLCNALDVNMEDIMKKNINKLRVRYPDKFTEQAANNRDLDSERKVLEQ